MSLQSNKLTKIEKHYFEDLKSLKELDLSDNQIKDINLEYFYRSEFPMLERLILKGNSKIVYGDKLDALQELKRSGICVIKS